MTNAIEFNHVSKLYRLGLVSTGALKDDLHRFWVTKILQKEDPYLKIGTTNDRTTKADSDYVWALRDIDFNVEQGDVVGIIGKNGAGKSTLLKLLSRVTGPTTGTIKAHGRIGSLLEVGTGFHPEMTGRENIFMNGAILGMTHKEIQSKLDAIVDFSGCERYIDTPVKRYSSGMMVRLGFAVAAHLDPEILVVDEVLAVGDAEFQKKAIGKMKEVSKGEGRTVLFVSHNMASVKNLCQKGVVLKNGMVDYVGTANDAVDYYIENGSFNAEYPTFVKVDGDSVSHGIKDKVYRKIEFVDFTMINNPAEIATDEPLEFIISFKRNNMQTKQMQCAVIFKDMSDVRFATFVSPLINIPENETIFKCMFKLKDHNLACRKYKIQFDVGLKDYTIGAQNFDYISDVFMFQVTHFHKEPPVLYAGWDNAYGYILNNNSITYNLLK